MLSANNGVDRCSDKLWIKVMQNVIDKNPEENNKFWRAASATHADCSLCKELGGGVLLKCCAEKCKKEYHVDCAFNEGGLSLDEDGVLKFQCETHFKPIVFCNCQQSYDESRGYICCDFCCEWFHYTCVGLKDTTKLDKFKCQSCLTAILQKRDISAIKEANLEKELLSSSHQTAVKAVGALAEVTGSICPIIDQLAVCPFYTGKTSTYFCTNLFFKIFVAYICRFLFQSYFL